MSRVRSSSSEQRLFFRGGTADQNKVPESEYVRQYLPPLHETRTRAWREDTSISIPRHHRSISHLATFSSSLSPPSLSSPSFTHCQPVTHAIGAMGDPEDERALNLAFQTLLDGTRQATEQRVELTALRKLCSRGAY